MIHVKDLPGLRRELIAEERAHPRDEFITDSRTWCRGLDAASLWWVSRDMTALAVDAAETLPDWTPMIARPDVNGLLVWAGDTITITIPGTGIPPAPLRGIFWMMAGDRVRVTALTDHPTRRGHLVEIDTGDFAADVPMSVLGPRSQEAIVPMIQLIGSTWLLMQQPTVADRKTIDRSSRRRGELEPGAAPSPTTVQVIDLRTIRDRSDERDPDTEEHPAREYRHRWMVRGHWRQQACGPGRTHRRPVYIPPHLKGPADAPLLTDRVHAWRR